MQLQITESRPVVIVGAGLAGLTCAVHLHRENVPFLLLEKEAEIGGRVRTDEVNGFLLDRGFQVFLEAYPEARRLLDYQSLDLQPFYPGALVRTEGAFRKACDPFRKPFDSLSSILRPVAPLTQLIRIVQLRGKLRGLDPAEIFRRPEQTTADYLREFGFRDRILDRFFRPFFGGIFLERELATSSRMFEFVFQMMAAGRVSVPRSGMHRIPRSLYDRLPPRTVRTGMEIEGIDSHSVRSVAGDRIEAGAIVLALPGHALPGLLPETKSGPWNGQTCVYFDAPEAPVDQPILILDAEPGSPINSLAVMSLVSPDYAPSGRHLIAVTLREARVVEEGSEISGSLLETLGTWFGKQVDAWKLLRSYTIRRALPRQEPGFYEQDRDIRIDGGLYRCGDHLENGSINGALLSGKRAAEEILNQARF